MDASALVRELDTLEKSSVGLDFWLNFWTATVVGGVAVELIVLIVEYVHGWRDFKRASIRSPERPSLLLYGLGFLGAALVAIGVAGEFRIHAKAAKIESDIREATRQLVLVAEEQSARAQTAVSPLSLSEETQHKIAEELRPLAKTGIKMLVVHTKGPNGMLLGMDIFVALQDAGFNPRLGFTDKAVYGVVISSSRGQEETAREIRKVLGGYLSFVLPGFEFLPPDSPITISVGERWTPFVVH